MTTSRTRECVLTSSQDAAWCPLAQALKRFIAAMGSDQTVCECGKSTRAHDCWLTEWVVEPDGMPVVYQDFSFCPFCGTGLGKRREG